MWISTFRLALNFMLINFCSCSACVCSHHCVHAAVAGPRWAMVMSPGALHRTAALATDFLRTPSCCSHPCSPSLSVSPSRSHACLPASRHRQPVYVLAAHGSSACLARSLPCLSGTRRHLIRTLLALLLVAMDAA
jgi:hypothetical protein